MKIRTAVLVTSLAFTLALVAPSSGGPQQAHAQVSSGTQIYLQLPGVDGTAVTKGFEKQIVLSSSTTGIARAGGSASGGGAGAGKAQPIDLSVGKDIDAASPALYVAAASGKHYPTATVTIVAGASQTTTTYKLTDVSVTSLQQSASEGAVPHEAVTLTFAKFEIEVKAPAIKGGASKGTTRGGYDFATAKVF